MCGIAGFVGDFKAPHKSTEIMLSSLEHRGPDDQQIFQDNLFCGGMRRLAINDLQGGAQPLFNKDKSIVTFYNGEIYNYHTLRNFLEGKKFSFNTSSDGEVIPFLYELYGTDAFSYLDGMFAISIWDRRTSQLILARDFPGEKPLYYSKNNAGFIYSSEVKAMEAVLEDITLDRQALWDFPSFLWIPEPATAYEEINALGRGNFLILSPSGEIDINEFTPRNYKKNFHLKNLEEAISTTREVVENSITSRLLSDVPVGSFLSGGLDSSIVATVASQKLSSLDTFTIEFEDLDDPYHGKANESVAARETANFIGSNHHNVPVTSADFRSSLKDFVKYGVIILDHAPKQSNSLELLSKRFGPIHETLFERIHNVSVTGHVYNVAHTSKGLPPHNDFASYKYQPSVQALHMLENECEGGESIIVDGWKLVDDLKKDYPHYFDILCSFNIPFREFDDKNETFAEAPLIQCDSNGKVESFRFSNQLMQMIDPCKKDLKDFYYAYHEVSKRVYDDKYRSVFRLNGGEVLIVASLRVLHARESFIPNGKRHLQDAYYVYDNAANNIVLLSS